MIMVLTKLKLVHISLSSAIPGNNNFTQKKIVISFDLTDTAGLE